MPPSHNLMITASSYAAMKFKTLLPRLPSESDLLVRSEIAETLDTSSRLYHFDADSRISTVQNTTAEKRPVHYLASILKHLKSEHHGTYCDSYYISPLSEFVRLLLPFRTPSRVHFFHSNARSALYKSTKAL